MSGEIINVGHKLELVVCVTCGVMHAVPTQWLAYQRTAKDGEIYCPAGHVNHWGKDDDDAEKPDEKDSTKVAELRKELVLAVHRAEQAEARAADEARLNDEQTEIATRTPGLAIAPAEFRVLENDRRVGCPCCDSTFRVGHAWFRRHLVKVHGWTPAQFGAAMDLYRNAGKGAEHAKK